MHPERKIKLASIYAVAPNRKDGYVEEILKRGSVEDSIITISEEDFQYIKNEFSIKKEQIDAVAPPALKTMAKTAMTSAAKWLTSGAKTTDPEILKSRIETCQLCEFWNPKGFGGTGRCMKCGCSTWAKLRMATEKCPIGKW